MSDEQATASSERPPLRLHHFFMLIAATAVVLVTWRKEMEAIVAAGDGDAEQPSVARWIISAVVYGGQLTVSLLVVIWRCRRVVSRIQPGEWLSLITTTSGLLQMLWYVLFD